MPKALEIHGWVEATRYEDPERSRDDVWEGVLKVSPLIDAPDSISERLFGFARAGGSGATYVLPLAAGRGLPRNPSRELTREINYLRKQEHAEIGGYTFAIWSEIMDLGLTERDLIYSDWAVVFDLVQRLERDARLSAEQIRVVTYFRW